MVPQRWIRTSAFVLLVAFGNACKKQDETSAGTAPEVVFATVEKQSVEIYSEWVGTTTGFVNAQIYPKVQGYLMKQAYHDGSFVQQGPKSAWRNCS